MLVYDNFVLEGVQYLVVWIPVLNDLAFNVTNLIPLNWEPSCTRPMEKYLERAWPVQTSRASAGQMLTSTKIVVSVGVIDIFSRLRYVG